MDECGDREAAAVPAPLGTEEAPRTRQIVLAAVLRGLVLDDPWRHAYLRHRWTGIDGKGHLGTSKTGNGGGGD